MDLPILVAMPVPVAAELAMASLAWALAVLLGLNAPPGSGKGRSTDRVRLAMVGASTGLGHWAALLCALAALTGAPADRADPAPFLASLALAMAVVGLPARAAASGPPALSVVAALASAVGLGAAALVLARSLGGGLPPAIVLIALGSALLAGQLALAWAHRVAARPDAPQTGLGRLSLGLAVALAWALPLLLVALALPAAVAAHGSKGGPWLLVLFALLTMGVAGAGMLLEHSGGGAQRQLRQRLRHGAAHAEAAAAHDGLTGLPNRAGFTSWLGPAVADAVSRGGRVALLVVGLDGFKRINDAFGMRSGDAALVEVARRLNAACPELSGAPGWVAGPLARTGGDEFTLVLQGSLERDDAARVAARVLAVLAQPFTVDGVDVAVTASLGVACAPQDGVATTLQAHAEAALRAAKQSGGGTYALFEPRLVDEVRDRLDLLRDLRRAVDERQLELFYQPKIDARSGLVTAAEALLRWNHPTRGMIGPDVFIPLAERYGLIGTLGDWVVDDACRQARVWRKAGLKMRVAINLSAYQMRQDGLVGRILDALEKHGIDPSRLTCEITETVAMEDTQVTQRTFEELGQAGIHLSIDDFGTGYSSLAYLRRLPASELKIDRAFVKDLGASDDARAIADAVVKMAHAIGLRVVAEGVETLRQRDVLLELGCDELQGYLFAKPMSARALLLWALDDRPERHAFRPSLFADTNTPTRLTAPLRASG